MYKLIIVLALAALVSAGLVPSIPVPGKGADALFIFAAYSNVSGFAWGSLYWNPTDNQFPFTWSYDTVNPSPNEPMNTPYHWNGGLGTALTSLGYTWEWYPTWDDEDGMQAFPDVAILQDYDVVFVHTFDNWENQGISTNGQTALGDYMTAGGKVVFIGQDAHYGGLSDTWLNEWFSCGTVTNDVINGVSLLAATGSAGTFLNGWAGTADMANFSDANGFYTDALSTNGIITDGTNLFASSNDATKCIFSTYEFEACDATEVEAIADLIMTYIGAGGSLEQRTWSSIKSSF